jgi:hypothetical protein
MKLNFIIKSKIYYLKHGKEQAFQENSLVTNIFISNTIS